MGKKECPTCKLSASFYEKVHDQEIPLVSKDVQVGDFNACPKCAENIGRMVSLYEDTVERRGS